MTWALSAVSLFFGFLIGGVCVLLAVAVGFQVAPGSTPAPAATDPHLEIAAPIGTQIVVDGEAVGKTATVTPGVPHELVVTLQGAEPWKTTLTLQAGETRVFVISEAQVHPADKSKARNR